MDHGGPLGGPWTLGDAGGAEAPGATARPGPAAGRPRRPRSAGLGGGAQRADESLRWRWVLISP